MDDLTAADYRLLLSLLKFAIVAPEQRDRVQSALEQEMACAEAWENPQPARGTAPPLNSLSFESVRKMTMQALMQENVLTKGLDETGHERN
jgi:hypothetical protein